MVTEPLCRGRWLSGRNRCECAYCQTAARARNRYIDASEQVHRLVNRGADPDAAEVRAAEQHRDRTAAEWERAYAGEQSP